MEKYECEHEFVKYAELMDRLEARHNEDWTIRDMGNVCEGGSGGKPTKMFSIWFIKEKKKVKCGCIFDDKFDGRPPQ